MVKDEEASIQCGKCKVIVGKDEKNRPTLTPFCPPGENGEVKLSDELIALKDAFQSEEVVLKPAQIMRQ